MTCRRLIKCIVIATCLALPISAIADSVLDKLHRIPGLMAAPGQLRTDGLGPGSIWIAFADRVGTDRDATRRLTADSGYHSPVFSPEDGGILALRGDTLVRLPLNGSAPEVIQRVAGAVKLVGFDSENLDEIVILLDVASSPLAVLSLKNRKLTPLEYDVKSDDQRRMLAQIRGQDRAYGEYGMPSVYLYLQTERKQGLSGTVEWTDVYLRRRTNVYPQPRDSAPQNLTRCDGVNCGQPALSPGRRVVVFVKTGR